MQSPQAQETLINFVSNQLAIGGSFANMIRSELAEMSIQDEYTGLENRLARELRAADVNVKPVKIETVPCGYDDELSGDYYSKRALFYADGTVEVVTYKGEGEAFFSTESEYRSYVDDILNPEPDYNYNALL
jgi:hypothetical protein